MYTEEAVDHGDWMDRLVRTRLPRLEAIGFVDVDCLAYSHDAVSAAYGYVMRTQSFLGLAQSANHIRSSQIYAAPSFLIISRRGYDALNRPSLKKDFDVDAAQNLSRVADKSAFAYRAVYPIGYYDAPPDGPWQLGNYGYYGLGTEYEGGFFHNFNSRLGTDLGLFRKKVEAILANERQPTSARFLCHSLDNASDVSEPRPDDIQHKLVRARQQISMWLPRPVRELKRRLLG